MTVTARVGRAHAEGPRVSKPLGIYCRVSAIGDREDEGRYHSPVTQERKARERAEARGYAVVGPTFVDENESGAVHPMERPEMKRALDAIDRGELGGLTAMDLSRITREPEHGAWLVRFLNERGAVLVVPQAPEKVQSATDRFHFAIQLEVDALYRRQAGERLDIEKERATREGLPIGPVPVGYMREVVGTTRDGRPVHGPMVVDTEVAPVIAEMFERRAAGAGYAELAAFLEERGVSSWRDRKEGRRTTWTRQAIAAMLRRELYATGHLTYGSYESEHDAGAIVDRATFTAAQRKPEQTKSRRWPASPWTLTGFVTCECGHRMAPWTGSRRRRRDPRRGKRDWVEVANPSRRYKCRNRACQRPSVDATRLEASVMRDLRLMLGSQMATRHDPPDLSGLEDAADVAQRRYEQITTPDMVDALGPDLPKVTSEYRKARDETAAALGAARAAAGRPTVQIADLEATWDDLPVDERRDVLRRLYGLERVIVHGTTPDTWELVVTWDVVEPA